MKCPWCTWPGTSLSRMGWQILANWLKRALQSWFKFWPFSKVHLNLLHWILALQTAKAVENVFASHNHRPMFASEITKQSLALRWVRLSDSCVKLLLLSRSLHSRKCSCQQDRRSSITDTRRYSLGTPCCRTIFGLQVSLRCWESIF